MSKRVFALFVAFCVAFSLVTVTAAANEIDTAFSFIDVLDYTTERSYNSNPSGVLDVLIPLPYEARIFYVDAVFWSSSGVFDAYFGDVKLNYQNLGDNYYRVYGTTSRIICANATLKVVYGTSGTKSIQFVSFNVSESEYLSFYSPSKLVLENQSVTQSTGQSVVLLSYESGITSQYFGAFGCDVVNTDWRKYDYMKFCIFVESTTFNSLTCAIANQAVPFEMSFVDASLPDDNAYLWPDRYGVAKTYYEVCVTVDLRGVDRTLTNDLYLSFYGTADVVYVALVSSCGYIGAEGDDPELTWLQRIWKSLEEGFQDLVHAIRGDTDSADDFNDELQTELDKIEEGQDIVESMTTPDLESIVGDIDLNENAAAGIEFIGGVFDALWSTPLSAVFLYSGVFALVGYLLYGRRH